MCRLNLVKGLGPVMQICEGYTCLLYTSGYKYEKYIRNITNYLTKHKDREIIPRDNISTEENTELYDVLTGKMLNTVLSVKFSGIGKKLEKRREEFVLCSPEKQCYVLNEILKILHANVLSGEMCIRDSDFGAEHKSRK